MYRIKAEIKSSSCHVHGHQAHIYQAGSGCEEYSASSPTYSVVDESGNSAEDTVKSRPLIHFIDFFKWMRRFKTRMRADRVHFNPRCYWCEKEDSNSIVEPSVSEKCYFCLRFDQDCLPFDDGLCDELGEDEVDPGHVADDEFEDMDYIADIPDGEYDADRPGQSYVTGNARIADEFHPKKLRERDHYTPCFYFHRLMFSRHSHYIVFICSRP